MVDATHTAIDFYSPELMNIAPDIEYTQDYFDYHEIVDMQVNFNTNDYRNKQVIVGEQVFSSLDTLDTIIATTEQTKFTTSLPVGKLKEVYVNGVSKTIGNSEDKELGIYADFYYTIGTNEIESSTSLVDGAEVKLIYISLIKDRQVITNGSEINRINTQINRKGVIARYETRNDTSSSKELARIATTYLNYKGKAEINLTIITQNFDIFELGQQTYFNAPINNLKGNYLVKSKDTQITQTGTNGIVLYTYILTNSFDTENEINFFDNQRRKRSGNLAKNEFITRNVDINNEMTIIFNPGPTTKITITDNNELNSSLNTPFIE